MAETQAPKSEQVAENSDSVMKTTEAEAAENRDVLEEDDDFEEFDDDGKFSNDVQIDLQSP